MFANFNNYNVNRLAQYIRTYAHTCPKTVFDTYTGVYTNQDGLFRNCTVSWHPNRTYPSETYTIWLQDETVYFVTFITDLFEDSAVHIYIEPSLEQYQYLQKNANYFIGFVV